MSLQSEEGPTVPVGAGDGASDSGEAWIGFAAPGEAFLENDHLVRIAVPFTEELRALAQALLRWSRWFAVCLLSLVLMCHVLGCTTPAGRTTGEVIDDSTITTKVKGKIFGDSILKGFAISVKTFQGEVTLTGGVKTESDKKRAGDLARGTTGVRKVHNLIKIKEK